MNSWLLKSVQPMMNRALSQLGLAMRAGKVVTGDEIVLKAIRSSEAKLVILAGDASDNTKKSSATNAVLITSLW